MLDIAQRAEFVLSWRGPWWTSLYVTPALFRLTPEQNARSSLKQLQWIAGEEIEQWDEHVQTSLEIRETPGVIFLLDTEFITEVVGLQHSSRWRCLRRLPNGEIVQFPVSW